MRRLILAASGLGLSVLVSIAIASPPLETATQTESDLPHFLGAETQIVVQNSKAADPETVLREQYLKLMQEKAALMDKAALEAALAAAQQDIRELEADKLLDEAKAILQRVVDDYPNTRGASEASVLLRHHNPVPADLPHNSRPL